jgi:hypothetical protein
LDDDFARTYPRAAGHFGRLVVHPAFAPDTTSYLEKIEPSG